MNCKNYNLAIHFLSFNYVKHLKSVKIRHINIQKYYIRMCLICKIKTFKSISSLSYNFNIIIHFKKLFQTFSNHLMIICK